MTYRDQFELDCPGIVLDPNKNCPCHFGYTERCPNPMTRDCSECWDLEIPDTVSQENTAVMVSIMPVTITIYPNNIPDPDEMISRVIKTAAEIKHRLVSIVIM